MSADRVIDVRHLGRERVIGAHLAHGCLVDPGPASALDALLEGLAGEEPERILLTHIHLDHAGATGVLARRWPRAEIWVHPRGARHLADPSKLIASAERLYGADMERLWGEIAPVPAERLRLVGGEGEERIGAWRVAPAPGHASHHVAYLHEPSAIAYTGDVAGVKIGDGPVMAPTPPPDVDVPAWRASLDLLRGWRPERIAMTHFGTHGPEVLDGVERALARQAELAARLDQDAFVHALRAELDDPTYEQAMPYEHLWLGLDRARTLGRT
jgi:glyoxylase-like metal-dependent hydrolase (beta-lactamase superfamily II)